MLLGRETCKAQWAQTARVTVVRPTKDHVAAATALPSAMRYRNSVMASSKPLGSVDGLVDGLGKTDAAPLRSWAPQPSLQGSHSSRKHQQRSMWSDRPRGVVACFDLRHHFVSHRTFRQVADAAKDHIMWMITPWAPSRQRTPSTGARDHITWMITPWRKAPPPALRNACQRAWKA